jgi:hypothetical protein
LLALEFRGAALPSSYLRILSPRDTAPAPASYCPAAKKPQSNTVSKERSLADMASVLVCRTGLSNFLGCCVVDILCAPSHPRLSSFYGRDVGLVMFYLAGRLSALKCYRCHRPEILNPIFFMKDARCQSCGVSPGGQHKGVNVVMARELSASQPVLPRPPRKPTQMPRLIPGKQ